MSTKSKRGQGSLEFLMTYSWALVLLVIILVVAWRWGVFSLTETVKPGNYGFWGVTPSDIKMSNNGNLKLSLSNDVGVNVTVNYVKTMMASSNVTVSGVGVIEPGKATTVDISGLAAGGKGTRFDVFVVINYSNSKMQANRERLSSGTIWGSYE